MLKGVTEGRGADSLSCRNKKAIKDLGRYANLGHSPLSTMTNDIRIMHNIESRVREHWNSAEDLREHHPVCTEERLISWKTELWTILEVLDVRDFHRAVSAIPKLFQEDMRLGGAHAVGETSQHVQNSAGTKPSVSDPIMVCHLC